MKWSCRLFQARGRRGAQQDAALALGPLRLRNDIPLGLVFLADGCGGLDAGDAAAATAQRAVLKRFFASLSDPPPGAGEAENLPALAAALLAEAHRAIRRAGIAGVQARPASASTALLLLLRPDGAAGLAWAGDSLAWRLDPARSGESPRLLTRPHNAWRDPPPGEKGAASRPAALTRCLGQAGDFLPEALALRLEPGAELLLATDGVWELWEERGFDPGALESLWSLPGASFADNATAALLRVFELSDEDAAASFPARVQERRDAPARPFPSRKDGPRP